jgi:hypothetical protein
MEHHWARLMLTASCQFVLVTIVDDRRLGGHGRDGGDEQDFDQVRASS